MQKVRPKSGGRSFVVEKGYIFEGDDEEEERIKIKRIQSLQKRYYYGDPGLNSDVAADENEERPSSDIEREADNADYYIYQDM